MEPGSLTESHRLKEGLRGGLDPLLRKTQTPVTTASKGRGQAAALERPNSLPLQSSPICILLPLFPSAGDAAAWPLSGRVLWLPLRRQEEGHSITTLLSNKGLHFWLCLTTTLSKLSQCASSSFIQAFISTYYVPGTSSTLKTQFTHSSRPLFIVSSGMRCRA